MYRRIRWSANQGQGLVEYALIMLLVAVVVAATLPLMASALLGAFNSVIATL